MVQEKSNRPREKQREGFAVPMAQALAQDEAVMRIAARPRPGNLNGRLNLNGIPAFPA